MDAPPPTSNMSDTSAEDEEMPGVLIAAKDAALKPFHYVTSKPARRAYLSTALFLLTSLFLLGTAALAYVLFYNSYIPNRGFSRPVYLQFNVPSAAESRDGTGGGSAPWGTASLDREIISNQRYDVSVLLHMPRTPANKNAGNFMLDLQLFGPSKPSPTPPNIPGTFPADEPSILAHSRRPAILTYYSTTMEHVHRLTGLLWYILGFRREDETLVVPMFESVEFARGWRNIPSTARLELQSGADAKLQVYSVKVQFTARLRGLRWLMYRYRLTTFVVMTGAFWAAEMGAAAGVWLLLHFILQPHEIPQKEHDGSIKAEDSALSTKKRSRSPRIKDEPYISDTPRTYPSSSRDHPITYTSPLIKSEEAIQPPLSEIPPLGAEADDEDEDADFVLDEPGAFGRAGVSDSGIGTSLESGVERRESMRRRTSRILEQQRQRDEGVDSQ
jgi:seipin